MNIIKHAQFGEIRMKTKANEPWFCAKDLCLVLGLEWKRGLTVRYSLDEDEVSKANFTTAGGSQEMVIVNESGLYSLIFQSRKPEARKFRKWVTSEVLPAIRKYGTYSTDNKTMDKAKARAEQKAIKQLLDELDNTLSSTDKRLVAKHCLTTEYHVTKVLRGEVKDAYMLSLLYARANGNIQLHKQFYTHNGAEYLLKELRRLED